MTNIQIEVFPRIAINLIAMHNGEYRKNGGIGFSVQKPSLKINFTKSNKFNIIDGRKVAFDKEEKSRLLNILEEEYVENSFEHKIVIVIEGELLTHYGFGSSTSVRLACLEGLYLSNNHKYEKQDLIKASRRGGTSGIGINTYFDGGYVFDIGKKIDGNMHEPSSTEDVIFQPLKISFGNMPSWNIGICIPNLKPKSENDEKLFFNEVCPIDENEAHKMLYHTVYGILASIIEDDIDIFCNALKNIQNLKWKKSERNLYGDKILDIENILYGQGAFAVGMSSFGPLLFFMAKDVESVVSKAKKALPNCQLFMANVNNNGRQISYD